MLVRSKNIYISLIFILSVISVIKAGDPPRYCNDILSDPYVLFDGPGIAADKSNLVFEKYCGATTTPTNGAARESDPDPTKNRKESNCRVKCSEWPHSLNDAGQNTHKLIWVRTKKRWLRTKFLSCKCRTTKKGEDFCRFGRKKYNYKDQGGRTLEHEQAQIQIACEQPGCTHPSNIPQLNTELVPEILNKANEVQCTDCNVNTGREGVWKCWNEDGSEIADGGYVARKSTCKLTCDHNDTFDIAKTMKCMWPHKLNDLEQYKSLWRIEKQVVKPKWFKLMNAESGWLCTDALEGI